MAWQIEISETAEKQLSKVGKPEGKAIIKYLYERVGKDPYAIGENLKGNLSGLRRYRIGNYRALCEIQDEVLNVLVVTIGHRSKVYGKH